MPRIPYPGGKARLAKQIISFLPREGRTYLEPFAGRGNLFWAAVELGLRYERWWLNDIATAPFFEAIRTHGHEIKVPPRSRDEFEKQRDAFKRGDPTAILLAPHLAYSGGLYESGVKGGSGCGDDDGGVSSTGFQKTLRECHRILHRTKAKITGLDWTRLPLNTLSDDDVVVIDAPYPHAQPKTYSDATLDYEHLIDVLLKAKFRWVFCGYPHPVLHRLGAPIWARDMQLLCVRIKAGPEDRNECVWANFNPEISKTQRTLPASVKGQIKAIADAASLPFRALNHKIDDGLAIVARDWNALIPYLLEMQRRLSAPGKRTDLRKGAPVGLTWTVWVETKKSMLGRSLRSVQRLLKGKTQASLEWHRTTKCREVLPSEITINKIHCGDCLTLMDKMPDGCADLIVTSPPYNLLNSSGGGMKDGLGGKWENARLSDGYESHADAMPHDEYVRWQRRCLVSMMRLLKDDGAIFYNHKWRVQDGLLQDRSDIVKGFPVRQIIIWQRAGGFNFSSAFFLPTYEVVYLICKPKFKLAPRANAIGDVWRISQETDNPHPAPFPVELAKRCIESTRAELVLDPFMGSGTTAIAAELCGRNWIGMEISQEYCKMANERIKTARKLKGARPIAEQTVVEPTSIM
jgi:site-specific DNA-methyltransferase (adenine-specific)